MKIIRPKELADLLSVSTTTLWRMEKRGELPPRKRISTRAVGWLESEIKVWLDSLSKPASQEGDYETSK
ncbi:MAG: AlpA family phage regulatory protein [Balneola sp.]